MHPFKSRFHRSYVHHFHPFAPFTLLALHWPSFSTAQPSFPSLFLAPFHLFFLFFYNSFVYLSSVLSPAKIFRTLFCISYTPLSFHCLIHLFNTCSHPSSSQPHSLHNCLPSFSLPFLISFPTLNLAILLHFFSFLPFFMQSCIPSSTTCLYLSIISRLPYILLSFFLLFSLSPLHSIFFRSAPFLFL